MIVEPMTDAELAELRKFLAQHAGRQGSFRLDVADGAALLVRLDAAEATISTLTAERDAAVARERERCVQIVSDRIIAARVGEIDQDLRSISHIIEHAIRHPTPTAAQEG